MEGQSEKERLSDAKNAKSRPSVLGVILARSGSKGLPGKHTLDLLGKPVIDHTIESALRAKCLDRIVLTSDDPEVRRIARPYRNICIIDRPSELASDTATVDSAARYAADQLEQLDGFRADIIVLLYGNIPIRPQGLIDLAIEHLIAQGADSVQSYSPVGKFHPDWMVRMEQGDRVVLNCSKPIYRRQDLTPMFIPNGAVLAVTRDSLYRQPQHDGDFHCFLGDDRRGIVHPQSDLIVDIDERKDLYIAEAILRHIQERKKNAAEPASTLLA